MKKSELKNYIKENIISTLSEDTDEEIAKTKELTAAVKDLDVAKKEAGIEEDYTPSHRAYNVIDGKGNIIYKHLPRHTAIEKASEREDYGFIATDNLAEANIGLADLQDIGYDDGEYAFDKHFNKSQLNNRLDTKYYTRGFVQAITDSADSLLLNENATPRGEDFTYDYEDIGQFYLEGFGKEHTLTQDQLGKLGKMITNRFYGGDIKKAYDDVYKTSQNSAVNRLASKGQLINPMTIDEEEIPTATMSKINSDITDASSAARAILDFYNQMSEDESIDFLQNSKFKIAINSLKSLAGDKEENPVTEDEDKEPTKSDIKKTKGLAKAKEELALLTREMKSLAKKYSKAEGADKEKLVKTLKAKTKLKKELENILDNKKI